MARGRLSNRRSCAACRRMHIKCDGSVPCKACQKANRHCAATTDVVSFRHDHNPSVDESDKARLSCSDRFDKKHRWLALPDTLIFIQQDVASILAESEFPWPQASPERFRSPEPPARLIEQRAKSDRPPVPAERPSDELARACDSSSRSTLRTQELSLWPLNRRDEAMLVCFFVNDVAPWLDYTDPHRHFGHKVVQAVAEHAIIKFAVFAISAKMLSISDKWDPVAADRYQAQCLQLFIPALLQKDPRLQGDFLCATTLILRLYDEMTSPSSDRCPHKHVLDTGVILRSQDPKKPGYSLCQSSLFVAMRQEIGLAVHTGTEPPRLAEHCGVSRDMEEADDYTWFRRILVHTEHVTRFVYGEQTRSPEAWDVLWDYVDDWRKHRPVSFDPIWKYRDETQEFPEMWFANDCHVAGQQYADICDMLLSLNNPRTPNSGLARLEAARKLEERIKMLLRRICGVALSNRKFRPAMSTAGMSIVTCGDRFTQIHEQRVALEILSGYEDIVQWPALRAQERLRALWNI